MSKRSPGRANPGPLFESDLDRLLAAAPAEAAPHLERLWLDPLATIPALRAETETYLRELVALSSEREFLDLGTARRLASQCLALLSWLESNNRPAPARLIQVAVRYFIEDDDGESDLDSPIGFDDDAAVVAAVARLLDQESLLEVTDEARH